MQQSASLHMRVRAVGEYDAYIQIHKIVLQYSKEILGE